MCPKFQVPGDNDLQKTPPSRGDTSDEVPKLQLKIGSVRGLVNATLLQRIPKSTMIAQLERTKHSRVVSNATKHGGHKECRAAYLCVTSESSHAGIARAVVCLSWLLEYVHCRKTGGEPDECVNSTRQTR